MPTISPAGVPVARPISARTCTEALYRAITAARYAPSAYNAQPWRWRLGGDSLDLFDASSRAGGAGGPDERLAALGCGAALQHARLALAARGWRITVTRQPEGADSPHVARIHIDAVAEVSRRAARAARNVRLRHTDPRPVTGEPLRSPDLARLTAAVTSEGSRLHVLRRDEILRLVLASAPTDDLEPVEAQWYGELTRWAGSDRIMGRDGRSPGYRGAQGRAATFAVLYGPDDELLSWLSAGEALSAAWLVATGMQISVLPFSAPIERPAARQALRRTFGDLGHPYLVVRLGRHRGPMVVPRSPRLPVGRIVQSRAPGPARPAP